jgi:hypothetical protein
MSVFCTYIIRYPNKVGILLALVVGLLAAGMARAETWSAALGLSVNITVAGQDDLWRVDLDGDGIPDYWEIVQFGSIGIVNGLSDFDGDGFPDRDEYIAGTNPRDPDSLLKIADLGFRPGGRIAITWDSTTVVEPGPRRYEVFASDDLRNNDPTNRVILGENIPSGGRETTITNELPASDWVHFGVGVQIQEE